MIVRPFRTDDLDLFTNFGGQATESWFHVTKSMDFDNLGDAFSAFGDGHFLGSLGCCPASKYRAVAWAMLHDVGKPVYFLAMHRAVLRYLNEQSFRRIECYVDPTHGAAIRWARLLGFEMECAFKPFFFPDGRGAMEFVRLS